MPPVKVDPSACKKDGSMCFARGNCKQVQCSVCSQWVNPGTTKAPKFPAEEWTALEAPPEKDYFCAYCRRTSRPAAWCCFCQKVEEWFLAHAEQIGKVPDQTPPGPSAGLPPSVISAGPPGPPYAEHENLTQEVEHLRQEVTDLRLKLSVLENIVQGLQKSSIMPE
jgi:hypothetical protein